MLCFLPFGFGNRRKISSASSASERCCSWLVQCTTMMYPIILEPVRPYSMLVDRPLSTHIKPLFLGKWLYQGGRRFLYEYQSHHSFSLWSFKYLHLLVTHSHKSSQSSWKRLKLSEANHGSEIRRLLVIAPNPKLFRPSLYRLFNWWCWYHLAVKDHPRKD